MVHVGPRSTTDEASLVAAAQAGDRDAFRALYLLHLGSVRGYLAKRSRSADLDDLTAETFARAFHQLHRFAWQGSSLRPWLLRLAQRELAARMRRRSSTEVVCARCDPGEAAEHADAVIDRIDAARMIGDVLTRLTPLQRTVLRLRYVDERPVSEVGRALGLTDEAVRALAHRALTTLRRALGTAGERAAGA